MDMRDTVTDNRIADAVAQMRGMRLSMREIERLYNRHWWRAEESVSHGDCACGGDAVARHAPRGSLDGAAFEASRAANRLCAV
jgi:hypothetical protein